MCCDRREFQSLAAPARRAIDLNARLHVPAPQEAERSRSVHGGARIRMRRAQGHFDTGTTSACPRASFNPYRRVVLVPKGYEMVLLPGADALPSIS
jgi:hypothetical protein